MTPIALFYGSISTSLADSFRLSLRKMCFFLFGKLKVYHLFWLMRVYNLNLLFGVEPFFNCRHVIGRRIQRRREIKPQILLVLLIQFTVHFFVSLLFLFVNFSTRKIFRLFRYLNCSDHVKPSYNTNPLTTPWSFNYKIYIKIPNYIKDGLGAEKIITEKSRCIQSEIEHCIRFRF